jgi:Holliday junction DNA helicase RuvA
MIGSLRGTILSLSAGEVLVEAGGVGYQVSVPTSVLSDLPKEGGKVLLFVHTHVREDAIQLFGFLSQDEKRVFNTLIGISGIGPKVALNIISGISHEDFLRAVDTEDITVLTRIPGLGKKTAHRIVLELRGKLPGREEVKDPVFEDTLSALVNLGYRKAESLDALRKAKKKAPGNVEDMLRESLKYLTGRAYEEG